MRCVWIIAVWIVGGMLASSLHGQDLKARTSAGRTSLTQPNVEYQVAVRPYIVLQRGPVKAVIVDNRAVDDAILPGHRAGYNGIASLTHRQQPRNVFVPRYAGLNFEHIHDGTTQGLREKFEPRSFPMQLRIIDSHTVELYQPPTGNWKLESCGRYAILEDGTIEYCFECIPRALGYRHNFIGLFWASYIDEADDPAIYFLERTAHDARSKWLRAVSPRHGERATHGPWKAKLPEIEPNFPLSLVRGDSHLRYALPWYYGSCRGMAVAYFFRSQDQIWFAQSPSGGGIGNPAWDFQWFIPDPQVGESYGFQMRLRYRPLGDHPTTRDQGDRYLQNWSLAPDAVRSCDSSQQPDVVRADGYRR